MKLYRLDKSQKLPITIEEGWAFFSNPENLKIITPDYMGFDIIAKSLEEYLDIMSLVYDTEISLDSEIIHFEEKAIH